MESPELPKEKQPKKRHSFGMSWFGAKKDEPIKEKEPDELEKADMALLASFNTGEFDDNPRALRTVIEAGRRRDPVTMGAATLRLYSLIQNWQPDSQIFEGCADIFEETVKILENGGYDDDLQGYANRIRPSLGLPHLETATEALADKKLLSEAHRSLYLDLIKATSGDKKTECALAIKKEITALSMKVLKQGTLTPEEIEFLEMFLTLRPTQRDLQALVFDATSEQSEVIPLVYKAAISKIPQLKHIYRLK